MDLDFLKLFVSKDKLGGWVRAGVASGLATFLTAYPWAGQYLTQQAQTAIGVVAASIVVGAWSHYVKS